MKSIFHFLSLFGWVVVGLSVTASMQAQEFTDAIEFNNFIVGEQAKVTARNLEYVSFSVHSEDYAAVEKTRLEVLNQLKNSISAVEKANFKTGEKLKNESLAVFKLYANTFNIDFLEILNLKKESQSSYEAMETYFKAQDAAEKKLDDATRRLKRAQEDFATTHELRFEQSNTGADMQNPINTINEVNQYSRSIFLIFFKVSKANGLLMEAISENKTNMVDVRNANLTKAAKEAIGTLRTVQPFKGNSEYRDACMEFAKFSLELSEKHYPAMFSVMRKKQTDLTQADVDQYNAATKLLNEELPKIVETFNKKQSELLQRHIPNLTPSNGVRKM